MLHMHLNKLLLKQQSVVISHNVSMRTWVLRIPDSFCVFAPRMKLYFLDTSINVWL